MSVGQGQLDHRSADRNLLHRNLVVRNLQGKRHADALRNTAFASLSKHDPASRRLAHTTFQGKLASHKWSDHHHDKWHWRHRHPITVIGWSGPLFWPYAYWDFVDYTFWPYAYDVFWPYAYDELYVGIFGPYAYEGPAYSGVPRSGRRARAAQQKSTGVVVCSERVPALTDWPIRQIAQAAQPDQPQQAALNDLKDAAAKALDVLQSACPDELPTTPTGRLSAMHKRIDTMLQALGMLQPPLQRFYDSLTDEQKARVNAVNPEPPATSGSRRSAQAPDLSQVCSVEAAKATDVPIERIDRALHPTDAQRSAFEALNETSLKAAQFLKANCPQEQTLTPPGRVAAMEQRLKAMLEAIKIVEPALEKFYRSLTDEQKARFNQLGARQS